MPEVQSESPAQRPQLGWPWPPDPPRWWTVTARPGGLVAIGTTIQLRAVSHVEYAYADAASEESSAGGLQWSLDFYPRGGKAGRNVNDLLSSTAGTSTSFVTSADGVYRASFGGGSVDIDAGQTSVLVAVKSDPKNPADHQRVYYTWWRLGQGGSGWRPVDLPDEDFRTDAAPTVTVVGNYMFLVAKGLDGYLYLNQGEIGKPLVGWRSSHDFKTDVAAAAATTTSTP